MNNDHFSPEQLARQWVEIQEQQQPGHWVWREISANIAPRREPRRRLYLNADGHAMLLKGAPDDRLECESEGHWSCVGQVLRLALPGWEGDYQIIQATADTLVLQSQQQSQQQSLQPGDGGDH